MQTLIVGNFLCHLLASVPSPVPVPSSSHLNVNLREQASYLCADHETQNRAWHPVGAQPMCLQ